MTETQTLDAARGGPMPDSDFLKQLVQIIRAEDSYGTWENKADTELLADFIITKEERRDIPIIGDPDPDVMWRVEKYYAAVGLLLEKKTGAMASPMTKMSHEGFGRIVLLAGKLVALSKHLRDIHRFGFETYAKLGEAGDKLVADAVKTVERFPDAAKA
ncbi:MAG: NifX-associated nitrogen fixation protein [Filomicrobium sp.]